jgi:hypothetical protein
MAPDSEFLSSALNSMWPADAVYALERPELCASDASVDSCAALNVILRISCSIGFESVLPCLLGSSKWDRNESESPSHRQADQPEVGIVEIRDSVLETQQRLVDHCRDPSAIQKIVAVSLLPD